MTTYAGNDPQELVYTAKATVTGGRQGNAQSHDPELSLDLATPKAMGGDSNGTNPEQLFAVGWAACFQGAMQLAAKEQRVAASKLQGSEVSLSVGLGPEGESFGIAAKIEVSLPNLDADSAQKLVERTHELCPYSKATAGNVPVELLVSKSLEA